MKKLLVGVLMTGSLLSVGSLPFTENNVFSTPVAFANENYKIRYPGLAQVVADELNVRSGPGTGYVAIDSLSYGHVVNVVEIKGDWGKITYTDGGRANSGWVYLDYIGGVC